MMGLFQDIGAAFGRRAGKQAVSNLIGSGRTDTMIKDAAKAQVDRFVESKEFSKIIDRFVREQLAKPEYAWFWFVKHMQKRMMDVDKTMTGKRAWELAAQTYREFLRDEKIEFGDPRYTWDRDGAHDVIQGYELDYWESAP